MNSLSVRIPPCPITAKGREGTGRPFNVDRYNDVSTVLLFLRRGAVQIHMNIFQGQINGMRLQLG
jgi:hypothetical protein